MQDTQNSVSAEQILDSRIQSLQQTHEQYISKLRQLDQEREATIASILKLEGALAAYADFKSTAFSTTPETNAASNQESEEVVDAIIEPTTETIN